MASEDRVRRVETTRIEPSESDLTSVNSKLIEHIKRVYQRMGDFTISCTKDDLIVRDPEEYMMVVAYRRRRIERMQRDAADMFTDVLPDVSTSPRKS